MTTPGAAPAAFLPQVHGFAHEQLLISESGAGQPGAVEGRPALHEVAESAAVLASETACSPTGASLVPNGVPGSAAAGSAVRKQVPRHVAEAVAVVGMGLAVPGASSPDEFWGILHQDRNTFGEPEHFDLDQWFDPDPKAEDKTHVRVAGFLRNFAPHPQLASELASNSWTAGDLTTLLLRHCLLQALDTVTRREGDRLGCYVGTLPGSVSLEESMLTAAAVAAAGSGEAADRLREALGDRYTHAADHPRDIFADRMIRRACQGLLPEDSDRLAVDSACSSSLYAIDIGVKSLLAGERDVVLCGGSSTGGRRDLVLFAKLKGLSANGEIRAFDKDACGVLFSDAAGIVTLKRLDRALADGDGILGLLGGFGGSVDGRGSVRAPDINGQELSVLRARAVNGIDADEVEWIVGHGTGTRVGDAVELEGLAALAGPQGHLLTSNKPLVGHGGWAAGVVSVVHALLAFKHGSIPGERYFTRFPDGVKADRITVPVTDRPWPALPGRRRTAAVCAYGLGGTNGHLVLHGPEPAEAPAPRGALTPRADDPMVLVGWQTHFPGMPGRDATAAWLRGEGPGPRRSFGDTYPLPPFKELRMPPLAACSIDRTHLMATAVASAFVEEHGELWERHRETTGVITGHMGPTRAMADYSLRVAADDLLATVARHPATLPADTGRLRRHLEQLRNRLPAANDDSMPGQLANVISCRVANRFRLNGVTLAVDSGRASTQAALHVAERYLATGELDVALVLGINGNSSPVMEELAGVRPDSLAEAAVLLVLTRGSLAREHGWHVLAEIATETADMSGRPGACDDDLPGSGAGDALGYQGAEGALAVLRAVHSGSPCSVVQGRDPGPRVLVKPATARHGPAPGPPVRGVERAVLAYRRRDAVPSSPEASDSPALRSGTLVLVDSAAAARALARRARECGAYLISTDPRTAPSDVVAYARPGHEEIVLAQAAGRGTGPFRDLLVVGSVRGREAEHAWPVTPPDELLRLQECVLPAVRELAPDTGGSVAALLLDPLRGHTTHPHLTLLTGFLRSLALELPCTVFALVTDATLEAGLGQVTAERSAHRDRTVVHYRQGLRYVEEICPAPLPRNRHGGPSALGKGAVVVATGGARGATAVAVAALAEQIRPRVWLLGTTPAGEVPETLLETPDNKLPEARRSYLAHELKTRPGTALPALNKSFDTLLRTREIQRTLRTLRALCGPDRVHYLVCDLREPEQVKQAAREVYAAEGRVDLLVHGAGIIRSAAVRDKTLADFRAVRDTKVAGYHHLKGAFADPAPRLWCNFGSVSGLTGCAGDTDYSPANEYLAAAARAQHRGDTEEFTISWGLWRETGMVKDAAGRLSRAYGFTGLDNADGAAVFLSELTAPRPLDPTPFYAFSPGNRLAGVPDFTAPAAPPGGLLGAPDRELPAADRAARWTWRADPRRDTYLAEHLADGRPLLPAAMMLALAAEAAHRLAPGLAVTGFRDLVIATPLYTDPNGTPPRCRILAEQTGAGRYRVTLRSDLVTPDGRVLVPDRNHCRVEVTLGGLPPAPLWQPPPPLPALEDCPTVRPDSTVQLSGVWRTNHHPGAGTAGGDALWYPRLAPDGIFARLAVPALLIDSLSRLFAYAPQPGGE
ncbi:hypothetical protein AF335_17305 [Streptomyces eurocidicus]|uniref:3-oxoacyl-(Acyl-carrier-protein) synthase/NAD(P)-dependent dehydrogenase (Short-subunit alcohol dehydrogenase family) n=1 Tax=Streptomyces eurocidicus TaxID=66423 RepID=A0A2N8NUC4_STREU|nr:SDR family oxidoreductase [Streptomyces eurocidicus]MBB5120217.1 3-oxoacyl-(acyl-carrier-protein) synthase/NAD(P)-dependent dehydrogenase (short-subunit alcohol dehydrogenase family) [Streptomyces eurocidicus]MBF6056098.1 SDR family oxidoreductase [Streptomyces eurocidicus]PNE32369.1 hypothetical protein AF335_17305 [Streptomyces eurocidicus]